MDKDKRLKLLKYVNIIQNMDGSDSFWSCVDDGWTPEKCFGEANLGKRLYRNFGGIEDKELEEWWKNVEPKLVGYRASQVDWYYNALYKNSIVEGTWNYSLSSKIVLSVVDDFTNKNGLRKLEYDYLWESENLRLLTSFCPFCIVVSIFKLKEKDYLHNFCFGIRSYEDVGEIESAIKTWYEKEVA